MRVVIDARIPNGVSGGVQQWVIGLASALSNLDADTEEFWFLVDEASASWIAPFLHGPCRPLVVPPTPETARSDPKETKQAIRMRVASAIPRLRTLRRVVQRRLDWLLPPISIRDLEGPRVDVLHFPTQAAFPVDLPSIYQPWDLQHIHLPEFFSAEQRKERDDVYRKYCNQASLIIAPTTWVKQDLVDQYGIEADRITVVNVPPVTAAYPAPTPTQIETIAAGHELPDRYVFYPAQTWAHKNHRRLFEALKLLRERGLCVPLICSGYLNELYPEVLSDARRLGIDSQVRFLGFVDPLELQVLYRKAEGLVFPTLYEGWGLPIVEAFANDLPVACSNVTSLPRLVGDAGILFDPHDPEAIASAIETIWTDDVLAAELALRGRASLGRFDWHRTALRMRACYRRTAGKTLNNDDETLLLTAESV